jgi:hypothetical protein
VCPQPKQRLGKADTELNRDHPGRLVDLGLAADRPGERRGIGELQDRQVSRVSR